MFIIKVPSSYVVVVLSGVFYLVFLLLIAEECPCERGGLKVKITEGNDPREYLIGVPEDRNTGDYGFLSDKNLRFLMWLLSVLADK